MGVYDSGRYLGEQVADYSSRVTSPGSFKPGGLRRVRGDTWGQRVDNCGSGVTSSGSFEPGGLRRVEGDIWGQRVDNYGSGMTFSGSSEPGELIRVSLFLPASIAAQDFAILSLSLFSIS